SGGVNTPGGSCGPAGDVFREDGVEGWRQGPKPAGLPMTNALVASLLASALLVGCEAQPEPLPHGTPAGTAADSATGAADCTPLETRPREAPERAPAFPGQTRACGVHSDVGVDIAVLT